MHHLIKKYLDKLWDRSGNYGYEKIWERVEKPFENEVVQLSDEKVAASYIADNKQWNHIEYVYRLQCAVVLEPDYTIAIRGLNNIVPQTIAAGGVMPSAYKHILSLVKPKTSYDKAILFDGVQGTNYFHFFSDVINKIWLLTKVPDYEKLPLIINQATYNKKYFQYLLNNTYLKNYNWVVQKGTYIAVKELYLLHPMPYDSEYFSKLKGLLSIKEQVNATKKVFLTRSKKSGRYLNNMAALQPILDKYGFETIDTDGMDLATQIELLANTKYLIGLHGASNTNILFSSIGLRFLEINPADRIACHYYWLATSLGIEYYDAISGSKIDVKNSYSVNAEKLELAIQKLLLI